MSFVAEFKKGLNSGGSTSKPAKHNKQFANQSVNRVNRVNRVERVWLASGIIGLMTTNPSVALEKKCSELNAEGYTAHQILPHSNFNILMLLAQMLLLFCTAGLWTFTPGYLILFKKK